MLPKKLAIETAKGVCEFNTCQGMIGSLAMLASINTNTISSKEPPTKHEITMGELHGSVFPPHADPKSNPTTPRMSDPLPK